MGRTPRPVEDAVLQALRKEMEPHGFRYKARKLAKRTEEMAVSVEIERYRWAPADAEMIDVFACFDGVCGASPEATEHSVILRLTSATGRRTFYGMSSQGTVEQLSADQIIDDFRNRLLPSILENGTPSALARSLLSEELAPGVPNYLAELERAGEAYQWATCYGMTDISTQATDLMRSLARNPSTREAALFAWKMLDLPGSPV